MTHMTQPASSIAAPRGSWCRMSRTPPRRRPSSRPASTPPKAIARPLAAARHSAMRRAAFETVAKAARSRGKAMGVGGVRHDFEFQSWLLRLGVRYLTGGSDVGYILSAGRARVKQLWERKLS